MNNIEKNLSIYYSDVIQKNERVILWKKKIKIII